MAVDFGKFSRSKAEAQKLQQAATQVKNSQGSTSAGALPSKITSTNSGSVFGSSSGPNAKVDVGKFIQDISGVDDLNDLSQLQKAQYDMLAAFADVDGDDHISKDEYNNLAALDGEDNANFTKDDIDALYEELGLASNASVDELMGALDKIFKEEEAQKTAETAADKVDAKTVPAEHSGAKINADGQYELEVETYRSGKVQDDGNGGTRYPNGSMWGMVTNAYPDVPEDQKEQVYQYMAELNGWDEGWQNHVLHTGDNVKMPVLEYDDKGNVTGYKDKIDIPEEEETKPSSPGSTAPASSGSTAPTSTRPTPTSESQKEYQERLDDIENYIIKSNNLGENWDYTSYENNFREFLYSTDQAFAKATTTEQKEKLFDDILNKVISNGNQAPNIDHSVNPYAFLVQYGDQIGTDAKFKAINKILSQSKQEPSEFNNRDTVIGVISDLENAGKPEQALAVIDKYKESNHGNDFISIGEDLMTDLYISAAKNGTLKSLNERFDIKKDYQDIMSGDGETKELQKLFDGIEENIDVKLNYSGPELTKLETKYLSSTPHESFKNILDSGLDPSEKTYLLKQLLSKNPNFSEDVFRAGMLKDKYFSWKEQEQYLAKFMDTIAAYTG
ncbi:MAG: hypothetical protein ACI37T_08090 [Candidatus Gastranaerophilaceae bacterium]